MTVRNATVQMAPEAPFIKNLKLIKNSSKTHQDHLWYHTAGIRSHKSVVILMPQSRK